MPPNTAGFLVDALLSQHTHMMRCEQFAQNTCPALSAQDRERERERTRRDSRLEIDGTAWSPHRQGFTEVPTAGSALPEAPSVFGHIASSPFGPRFRVGQGWETRHTRADTRDWRLLGCVRLRSVIPTPQSRKPQSLAGPLAGRGICLAHPIPRQNIEPPDGSRSRA